MKKPNSRKNSTTLPSTLAISGATPAPFCASHT